MVIEEANELVSAGLRRSLTLTDPIDSEAFEAGVGSTIELPPILV